MKFALVEEHRREAQRGLSGKCPGCGSTMVAKCGERRAWHWAHRGKRHCDHWWEPETEWHRAWKNQFPDEWQEKRHRAKDGEIHIADVKTEHGRVIEFQHSDLDAEERRARESFYRRMVWVVDGRRRKRDKSNFDKALRDAVVVEEKRFTLCVPANKQSVLLDWADSRAPVFFDFGDTNGLEDIFHFETSVLWRLDPKSPDGLAYLAPVWRAHIIESLRTGVPYCGISAAKVVISAPLPQRPLTDFERYFRKRRSRSWRRK